MDKIKYKEEEATNPQCLSQSETMPITPIIDNSDSTDLKKLDSNGQYCPYPGLTIVSAIGLTNIDLWTKIYESLNNSIHIKSYFALLPLDSYHMTTINIFTKKRDGGSNWNSFVEERLSWFQSIHEEINLNQFQPRITAYKPELAWETIYLSLQIDNEQIEKNKLLAKKYNLEHLVPSELHLTLGYLYKGLDDDNKKIVLNEFESIMNDVLKTVYEPIIFDSPKLTYFNDMTKFIPWDGKFNPFK
jgi:hypothetical protein